MNMSSSSRISDRILRAVDGGDYYTAMSLWDAYVLRNGLDNLCDKNTMKNLLHVETLINIQLATYPFRYEIVSRAGSAESAGVVAARSMAVFRSYVESRKDIMIKFNIKSFIRLQNIHRIGFPPTHPKYRDMFTDEWVSKTRKQIEAFLVGKLDSNSSVSRKLDMDNQSTLEIL